jgi:hypothetical protein
VLCPLKDYACQPFKKYKYPHHQRTPFRPEPEGLKVRYETKCEFGVATPIVRKVTAHNTKYITILVQDT